MRVYKTKIVIFIITFTATSFLLFKLIRHHEKQTTENTTLTLEEQKWLDTYSKNAGYSIKYNEEYNAKIGFPDELYSLAQQSEIVEIILNNLNRDAQFTDFVQDLDNIDLDIPYWEFFKDEESITYNNIESAFVVYKKDENIKLGLHFFYIRDNFIFGGMTLNKTLFELNSSCNDTNHICNQFDNFINDIESKYGQAQIIFTDELFGNRKIIFYCDKGVAIMQQKIFIFKPTSLCDEKIIIDFGVSQREVYSPPGFLKR